MDRAEVLRFLSLTSLSRAVMTSTAVLRMPNFVWGLSSFPLTFWPPLKNASLSLMKRVGKCHLKFHI